MICVCVCVGLTTLCAKKRVGGDEEVKTTHTHTHEANLRQVPSCLLSPTLQSSVSVSVSVSDGRAGGRADVLEVSEVLSVWVCSTPFTLVF